MRTIQRRLNFFVFLILLALGASGCARHGIVAVETSDSLAEVILIGDVNPVRTGTLETIRLADVSSGVIDWGLGYGTIEGPGSPMGETLFIGGRPVRASGVSPADGRFLGPFAVGLAPNQNPAARFRSAPHTKSISVADLLSDLASTYEKPVLVIGRVHFDMLVTGSGMDEQSPSRTLRNEDGLLIALVARHEDSLNQYSRRIFHIPEGMEGLVDDLTLSGAAVLSRTAGDWRSAGAQLRESIREVVPVDPASSRLTVEDVDVYLIDSIAQR